MMKTLCVAVVVLSLASVCQSASLACEKLVKPLDQGPDVSPDVSGIWYLIAVSTDSCLVTTVVNALLTFSVRMDVTPKEAPNVYDTNFKAKIYGYCANESENFYFDNNTIFDVNSDNVPYGKPDVILQSGCPDCIVVKGDDDVLSTLMLFSRRQNVSAAELKEFEGQAECLSWAKPLVLNTDHDYDNCPLLDDDTGDSDTSKIEAQIYQRLKTYSRDVFTCIAKDLLGGTVSTIKALAEQLW